MPVIVPRWEEGGKAGMSEPWDSECQTHGHPGEPPSQFWDKTRKSQKSFRAATASSPRTLTKPAGSLSDFDSQIDAPSAGKLFPSLISTRSVNEPSRLLR